MKKHLHWQGALKLFICLDDVLSNIVDRGIAINEVTLHVGAGTFLPGIFSLTDNLNGT